MANGLIVRNAANQIILNATDRLTQILGSVAITGGTGGSVTVPATGVDNAIFYVFSPTGTTNAYSVFPQLTISGNTITWTFPGVTGSLARINAKSGLLLYGRY
jgi:hypothetical protein